MDERAFRMYGGPGRPGSAPRDQAAEDVGPGVGDHSGPEAPAPQREGREQRAEGDDGDGSGETLVAVGDAEDQRLGEGGDDAASAPGPGLAQQVTAEHQLLAEPGAEREHDPDDRLHPSPRQEGGDRLGASLIEEM